jgi:hypothetical protein
LKSNCLSTFTFEYGTFTSEYTVSRSEQKIWSLNFAAMSAKVTRNFQSGWLLTETDLQNFSRLKFLSPSLQTGQNLPGDDENLVHFSEWLYPWLQTLSSIIFTIKATRQYFTNTRNPPISGAANPYH